MYVSRGDTNQKIASVVEGAETKANDVSTRFSFSEQTHNIWPTAQSMKETCF